MELECETPDWMFGGKGNYNNISQACDCPQGFSGIDMFVTRSDCHVSSNIQFYVVVMLLVVNSVVLGVLIIAGLRVLHDVQRLRKLRASLAKGPYIETFNSMEWEEGMSDGMAMSYRNRNESITVEKVKLHEMTQQEKQANAIYSHKLKILGVFICYYLCCLFFTPFTVLHLFVSESNRELKWVLYCFGVLWFWHGSWLCLYVYYTTLPNVIKLGAMLKIPSLLITYPNRTFIVLLYRMFWYNSYSKTRCIHIFISHQQSRWYSCYMVEFTHSPLNYSWLYTPH